MTMIIILFIFIFFVGLSRSAERQNDNVKNIRIKADFAIFLIGDSISQHLYAHIANRLNCKLIDPNNEVVVEQIGTHPYYCAQTIYNATFRLGYVRHWGVSRTDKDFFHHWKDKSFPLTNSNSSILNIKNAIHEFKQRSNRDYMVTYIFLSNLWDSHRYIHKYSTQPLETWLLEYKTNYTKIVQEMIDILHAAGIARRSQLVLQTQYHVNQQNKVPVDNTVSPMNDITRDIAKMFKLGIFDAEVIMRGMSANAVDYLADYVHLDRKHFDFLAKLVLVGKWTN